MVGLLPSLQDAEGILGNGPAPSWRWTVILPPGIQSLDSTAYNYTDITNIQSQGQGLTTFPTIPYGRAENITLPGVTIDADGRFGAATKQHYPRWLEVEAATISFYEDVTYSTLRYFMAWKSMIVDDNHNYSPSNYYKKSVFFMAFNDIDSNNPVIIAEMIGAFPTNAGTGIAYELHSSGIVTIPINFSIDDIKISWLQ